MKSIKRFVVMSSIFIGMLNGQLCAKVRGVMSQREFEQNVAHKGICVALFYNVTDKRNAPLRQDNKQLQRMFDEVSIKDSYDSAGLVFIKINLARPEFDTLRNQYKIDQVPQFVLFYDGQRVVDQEMIRRKSVWLKKRNHGSRISIHVIFLLPIMILRRGIWNSI